MINHPKILVVDDELPVCKSMASALENQGYFVDTALSGEEALKKDEEIKPDIIIADLMMPGMSGMDLLKTVREKRPEIIIIMVTGYPSINSAVQAIKLGAFDYIPKPFTPGELRSLVSRALERKQLYEAGPDEGKTVEISIPEGLYCIPGNSWAKIEQDGNVRVGIHHILINTIKDIISIEGPKENEKRYQGECCLWITDSHDQIHKIWSPVSGKIVAINQEIMKDYSKLFKDPYKEGWVLLIVPFHLEDDLKNLVVIKSP